MTFFDCYNMLYSLIQAQQHCSVRALYTCIIGDNPVIFAGGSDKFIRLWNLNNGSNCACVVRPNNISSKMIIKYR